MKEAFVVFSRLGTPKMASVSLDNLIKNIELKIGQGLITDVSFDIQINKLLMQANENNSKKTTIVPKVETKKENWNTTITISPLTPSNSMELQHCFEQVKQYIDFIYFNYPNATIHYMDVLNNRFDITFDEEIDFTNVTLKKSKSVSKQTESSSTEDEFDLFSLIDNEISSEKEEVPEKKGEPIEQVEETSELDDDSSEQLEEMKQSEEPEINPENEQIEQPTEEKQTEEPMKEEPSLEEKSNVEEEKSKQQESSVTLEDNSNRLMIIDGNNVLLRSYYATSYGKAEEDLAKDHEGKFINAIYVFLQSLERYQRQYNITDLAICWDNNNPFLDSFRKKLFPDYKLGRAEKPSSLMQQLETMPEWLEKMNVAQFMDKKGLYEADDLIGTLIHKWRKHDSGAIYIVSNDKDLYQLLDTNIYQIVKKGANEILYSLEYFQKEYGVTPSQWIDVKAIIGDKSDNIPGVSGVGEKYVYDLINEFGSIESIYNNLDKLKEINTYRRYVTKFESQRKEADLSKYLATIVTQAKVDSIETLDIRDLKININEEAKEQIYERVGLHTKQKTA